MDVEAQVANDGEFLACRSRKGARLWARADVTPRHGGGQCAKTEEEGEAEDEAKDEDVVGLIDDETEDGAAEEGAQLLLGLRSYDEVMADGPVTGRGSAPSGKAQTRQAEGKHEEEERC